MRAVSIPVGRAPAGPRASRRLLALVGDARLVDQIRLGHEAAFEVAFERHGPPILGFCRHMLGSREEAEDAVQHTFAAAHRDLLRDEEREITLKPWLFTIARNRCLSMLRARREEPVEYAESATTGLAELVEQRAELRQLLADVLELPEEQRAALLLAEIGDLSHTEVARVLGCEVARVKGMVFRARSRLIDRRDARETPCESIQEQLANLHGGSLRRTQLRLHLRECEACRAYRAQVKQQRQLLAAALPVAPTLALKSSVLAAVGIGGGSAGGGMAAGLTSIAAGLTGGTGGGVLAKVAIVGVVAGGGAVAGEAALDLPQNSGTRSAPAAVEAQAPAQRDAAGDDGSARPDAKDRRPDAGARSGAGVRDNGPAGPRERTAARGAAPGPGERGRGRGKKARPEKTSTGRGRGPIDAPPTVKPVRRGPPEPKPNPAPQARSSPRARPAPKVKPDRPSTTPPGQTSAGGPPSHAGKPAQKANPGKPPK